MDFQDRALDMMLAGAGGLADAFKLCFALSTGAVVLFAHILISNDVSRILLAFVAASVLCFGYSSIYSMHALLGIARVETGAAQALVKDAERRGDLFLKESAASIAQLQESATAMEQLFRVGVLFSTLFVLGCVVARFFK
jgi:hypothetical protein